MSTMTKRHMLPAQENDPGPILEWHDPDSQKVLRAQDVVRCSGHRGRLVIHEFTLEPGFVVAVCWDGDRWRYLDVDRLTVDRAATRARGRD